MPLLYDPILKDKRLGETSTLLFAKTATATVANTGTETTILSTGIGSKTLPEHYLLIGKSLFFIVQGIFSTDAVPGTLQLKVKLGSTTILDTGAQTPTASLVNRYFEISGIITCRTTGSSGTVFGQGLFLHSISATDIMGWDMENTATTTIDTTASLVFDITADWQTADTDNTISGTNLLLYSTSIN